MAKDTMNHQDEEGIEDLAPGCRAHPGRVGFEKYRQEVAGKVGEVVSHEEEDEPKVKFTDWAAI